MRRIYPTVLGASTLTSSFRTPVIGGRPSLKRSDEPYTWESGRGTVYGPLFKSYKHKPQDPTVVLVDTDKLSSAKRMNVLSRIDDLFFTDKKPDILGETAGSHTAYLQDGAELLHPNKDMCLTTPQITEALTPRR